MCQSAVFSPLVSGEFHALRRATPSLRFSENLPPGQGEPPARFKCPSQPVQRKDGRLSGLMPVFE